MLRSTKFPMAIGTMPDMMTTKMEENILRKTNTRRVKRISTGNLGKRGTKIRGTKIRRNNTVTRNPNPRMLALPLLKDVKYFCPTGFDEGIFNAVTKLLHEKVEQAKRSGSDNTKPINTIEHDNFCNFFKIPEQLYDAAFTQVIGEATPENPGEEAD